MVYSPFTLYHFLSCELKEKTGCKKLSAPIFFTRLSFLFVRIGANALNCEMSLSALAVDNRHNLWHKSTNSAFCICILTEQKIV